MTSAWTFLDQIIPPSGSTDLPHRVDLHDSFPMVPMLQFLCDRTPRYLDLSMVWRISHCFGSVGVLAIWAFALWAVGRMRHLLCGPLAICGICCVGCWPYAAFACWADGHLRHLLVGLLAICGIWGTEKEEEKRRKKRKKKK